MPESSLPFILSMIFDILSLVSATCCISGGSMPQQSWESHWLSISIFFQIFNTTWTPSFQKLTTALKATVKASPWSKSLPLQAKNGWYRKPFGKFIFLHQSTFFAPNSMSSSPNAIHQADLIRVVTKISSCRVNTTRRRGIKWLGISFGSIFGLFSNKSSRGPLS